MITRNKKPIYDPILLISNFYPRSCQPLTGKKYIWNSNSLNIMVAEEAESTGIGLRRGVSPQILAILSFYRRWGGVIQPFIEDKMRNIWDVTKGTIIPVGSHLHFAICAFRDIYVICSEVLRSPIIIPFMTTLRKGCYVEGKAARQGILLQSYKDTYIAHLYFNYTYICCIRVLYLSLLRKFNIGF